MVYAFALFFLLLMPGLCIASIARERHHTLALALPLSISLYLLVSLTAQALKLSAYVAEVYLACFLALLTAALSFDHSRHRIIEALGRARRFLPVLLVIWAYHLFVGAFVDQGVDVFQHMVYVQEAVRHALDNDGALKFALQPGTNNYLFHNIAVLLSTRLGLDGRQLIEVMAFAYSALWSLGVYLFSRYFLSLCGVTQNRLELASYLAVFFYWTAFGINNFSFARYYVGGPAILNYAVYLAALTLVIDQLRDRLRVGRIAMISLLFASLMLLHPQEAILLIAYCFSLSAVILAYRWLPLPEPIDIEPGPRNGWLSLAFFSTVVIGVVVVIAALPKYRFEPIPLLNLGVLWSQLGAWNILKPTHQFYTVLGTWGLYVYLLSLANLGQILKRVLMVAGLVLPLGTVFNPPFAEAYMRVAYADVLWRLLFALPLPIIAAWLAVQGMDRFAQSGSPWRYLRLVAIAPLFLLLLVFKFGPIDNSMAKSPSLAATPDANSYRHWQDLIDFLQSIDARQRVLTDPVTGYVVRSLTRHTNQGFKFYRKNFKEYNFSDYSDRPLKRFRGWILIVNLRDGSINRRLNPPFHIYPDVMLTSKHYGAALLDHVRNPEYFNLLYQHDGIAVYRIL